MSWDQLESILLANEKQREELSKIPPVTCPIDGSLLDVMGRVRHCPMGNYIWEG